MLVVHALCWSLVVSVPQDEHLVLNLQESVRQLRNQKIRMLPALHTASEVVMMMVEESEDVRFGASAGASHSLEPY